MPATNVAEGLSASELIERHGGREWYWGAFRERMGMMGEG
jgi:hypothetical protein